MHTARRSLQSQATVLVALALLTARGGDAQGPVFATLYSFKGGSDGASPNAVTLGKNGALYGTTYTGGSNTCGLNVAYLCGTVFELAHVSGGWWLCPANRRPSTGRTGLPAVWLPGGRRRDPGWLSGRRGFPATARRGGWP